MTRLERFMGFVHKTDSCWLWTGAKKNEGYGIFCENRTERTLAHRAAFEFFCGPIGAQLVLHKCDTPACVNPDHLFLGSHADNARDRDQKGRGWTGPNRPSRWA